MCKKISFNTEQEASDELKRIVETVYNPIPIRNKKPSRYYLCECGYYHLSSKPFVTTY